MISVQEVHTEIKAIIQEKVQAARNKVGKFD